MIEGENYVKLTGKIIRAELKTVGDYNTNLFKATLAIPTPSHNGYQYIKISSFSCADALGDLPTNAFVTIQGHIEEHAYDGACRHCGGFDKKYWTEVVIDNFIKL